MGSVARRLRWSGLSSVSVGFLSHEPGSRKVHHKEEGRVGQRVLGADKLHERCVLCVTIQGVNAQAANYVFDGEGVCVRGGMEKESGNGIWSLSLCTSPYLVPRRLTLRLLVADVKVRVLEARAEELVVRVVTPALEAADE